jgi:hypothetical protein
MTGDHVAVIITALGVVAFFVLLDKGADALLRRHGRHLPEGGLMGLLWRKLTGRTGK